jgi:GGDEF domain-containing protein
VARFLKRHIREADYIFRWGGDEFLVLITCSGEKARPPGIGLSVGWIEVPAQTTDLTPLVRGADTRMYRGQGIPLI